MAYDFYPAVDTGYNFPPEVRAALAASTELRNTVIPMTTLVRDNLTGAEKWDGRVILNTTIDRLERWDNTGATWQQVADILDLAPYTAALLQRPGRNRIINGDFAVNQRQFTTSTTTGAIGFDRWGFGFVGGTVTHNDQVPTLGALPEAAAHGARLVTAAQAAAGDYAYFYQKIESVRTLSGKSVTVSFWAKTVTGTPKISVELEQNFGTVGSPSATVATNVGVVTVSAAWTRYSVTVSLPAITGKTLGTNGDDHLRLNLWTSAGTTYASRTNSMGLQATTIDIWGVQVEEGSVVTPFEVEEYGQNLRRCQRYYVRLHNNGSGGIIGTGVNSSTTVANILVPLPVTLRRPPVASSNADLPTWAVSIWEPGVNTWLVSSIATYQDQAKFPNAIGLVCTIGSAALTAQRASMLTLATSGQGLSINAEI